MLRRSSTSGFSAWNLAASSSHAARGAGSAVLALTTSVPASAGHASEATAMKSASDACIIMRESATASPGEPVRRAGPARRQQDSHGMRISIQRLGTCDVRDAQGPARPQPSLAGSAGEAFIDRLAGDAFGYEALSLAEQAAGIGVWSIVLATGMVRATPQFFRTMGLEPTAD